MGPRLLTLVLAAGPALAQLPQVGADPRIELLSIVFHLAGSPEFNRPETPAYRESIHLYFGPFKNDEAIQMARELREKQGIDGQAVMSLAVNLKDASTLAERVPFDSPDSQLDKKWKVADARRFVAALRRFVERTKYSEFVTAQEAIYDNARYRMELLLKTQADLGWFDRFFGARPGARLIVAPGLLNGTKNYTVRVRAEDGREEIYAIPGVWMIDVAKQPVFDASFLPLILHQLARSYVDPLVDRSPALERAGDAIYKKASSQAKPLGYSNGRTLVSDSLARASVARYLLAQEGMPAAKEALRQDEAQSFYWIGEVFDLLGRYEADRKHYPTFESFLPKVTDYFESLAARASTTARN